MRDRMKARIASLQEYYSWQRPADEVVVSIFFGREDCDIAQGPADFTCVRAADETIEAFRARAEDAVLARRFSAPVSLVYTQREGYDGVSVGRGTARHG
jgi:hypothetical protein